MLAPVLAVLLLATQWGANPWTRDYSHHPTPADKLDVNPASFAQLRALPGMGDEYARRVIRFRPYSAKNQLATKGVLPQAEYLRIQELIVAHRQPHPLRAKK